MNTNQGTSRDGYTVRCDGERLLICEAEMSGEDESEKAKERELMRLTELIMAPERSSNHSRDVLIMRTAYRQIGEDAHGAVTAMDVLSTSDVIVRELLAAARVRKYRGSEKSAYGYQPRLGMWRACLTTEEGTTLQMHDFLEVMQLRS